MPVGPDPPSPWSSNERRAGCNGTRYGAAETSHLETHPRLEAPQETDPLHRAVQRASRHRNGDSRGHGYFCFFKQKTAYELDGLLEFRRVLFRSGVPARVVTGYQGGDTNPVDGYMVVR